MPPWVAPEMFDSGADPGLIAPPLSCPICVPRLIPPKSRQPPVTAGRRAFSLTFPVTESGEVGPIASGRADLATGWAAGELAFAAKGR